MNQIFKLFIPMLSSNLILVLSGLIDIAYVGHFSNDHVAALSVTLSLYTVIYVIGMGILQGVILKFSEAYGCHDIPRIRQIFIQGIWLMLCSALISIGLLYLFRDLPKLFGASEHVISITKNCIWALVFILPAHLLMRLFTALSQVTENAHKVLLSDSIFFILKIILSYLLIYGVALFSIPPLGAIGALLATLIVRWFMLAVYYLFFLDGLMALLTSLLRCWDVSILPMLIFLVVVLFFGLGGGWWMAYKGLHWQNISISAMGVYGFWWMAAISYLVACLLSATCFHFRKQLRGF